MSLNIPILVGTTRPGNKSQHAGAFIQALADAYDGVESKTYAPDMFDMPGDGNDDELKDPKYTKIIEEADAFVIIVPEYNHSFPGTLKRMIDSELTAYIHKPVALVGVSSGSFGGVRAVESILSPLRQVGMMVTFADVYFTKSYDRFDDAGKLVLDEEQYTKSVNGMFDELSWVAKSMQYGRENIPNKYHEK